MESTFFWRGLLLGISIAVPVGPIGVLCIRRTLQAGWWAGFMSGLGAATADAVYGSIAGFGLTFLSGILIGQAGWLRLVGGLFLCYLGLKTLTTPPADRAASCSASGLWGAYVSTVFLTLTNPATILSFVAAFAGLGLANPKGDYGTAMLMVAGVFLGSALWWLLLSSGVCSFRSRLTRRSLQWLNRISGAVIFGFGIVALSPWQMSR